MIYRAFTAMFVVLLIAMTAASLPADVWIVREDGIGPVKIGMKLRQLNSALQEKFEMPEDTSDQGCFYVTSTKHPAVKFMIEDGALSRIDVDRAGISTAEGVQVGDSEARVREVYGSRMKVEPSKYGGPRGHFLTIRSDSGGLGIRFETEKGKVARFYAGKFASIQYVEGCL